MDNSEVPPAALRDVSRMERSRRLRLIFAGTLIFASGVVLGAWIAYEPIQLILEVPAAEQSERAAPDDMIKT